MYEGGRWWEPELDGSIKIMQWDLFEDRLKFLEIIRDYQIHKGWYFKQIKNEGSKVAITVQGSKIIQLHLLHGWQGSWFKM